MVLFSGEFLVACAQISVSLPLIADTVTFVRLVTPEAPPVVPLPLAPVVPEALEIVVTPVPEMLAVPPALPEPYGLVWLPPFAVTLKDPGPVTVDAEPP